MSKYKNAVITASVVVILDQITKWLVVKNIPLYSSVKVLPVLDFTHIRNPGVAFGMLRDLPDSIRFPFFIVVLVLAVIAIFLFLRKLDNNDRILIYCLGLILGGAVGNSIDRFRLGYVTDFLNFHWIGNASLSWPPFNISDSAITVGAILVFIFGIWKSK